MLNYHDFDAILFDMDGTMFDSETVHCQGWKMTAKQFGQHFTDETYLQFIGKTTPDCMKLAMEMFNHQVNLDDFSARYYQNIESLVNKGVPLKPGFLAYLELVKKLNKPLGIVTSSAMAGVEGNFKFYDFYQAFSVIVTRDDVTEFKPSPEPYLLACQQLAVEPKRVLVFEDSNTGAEAALSAGCYTVGIADLIAFSADTKQALDLEIDSFEALL